MTNRLRLAAVVIWVPAISAAQSLPVPIPKALIFPNYDNVLVGKNQALEGGAYIARADGASANFYNPAGLVVSEKTSLNASSTGYVWTPASCCAASPRWFRRRALTSSATTAASRPPRAGASRSSRFCPTAQQLHSPAPPHRGSPKTSDPR